MTPPEALALPSRIEEARRLFLGKFRDMEVITQDQRSQGDAYWKLLEEFLSMKGDLPNKLVDLCGGGVGGEHASGKWVYGETLPIFAMACAEIEIQALNVDLTFPIDGSFVSGRYSHVRHDVLDADLMRFLPKEFIGQSDLVTCNRVFSGGISRAMKGVMFERGMFSSDALDQLQKHAWQLLHPGGLFSFDVGYQRICLQKQGVAWCGGVRSDDLYSSTNWQQVER
jgi:hypothetical protein